MLKRIITLFMTTMIFMGGPGDNIEKTAEAEYSHQNATMFGPFALQDDGNVYFIDAQMPDVAEKGFVLNLKKYNSDTDTAEQICEMANSSKLFVQKDSIYYFDESEYNYNLVQLYDTKETELYSLKNISNMTAEYSFLDMADDKMYFCDGGTLTILDRKDVVSTKSNVISAHIYEDKLYFVKDYEQIYESDLNGNEEKLILDVNDFSGMLANKQITKLMMHENKCYFLCRSGINESYLYCYDISADKVIPIIEDYSIEQFQIHQDAVYFIDYISRELYKYSLSDKKSDLIDDGVYSFQMSKDYIYIMKVYDTDDEEGDFYMKNLSDGSIKIIC